MDFWGIALLSFFALFFVVGMVLSLPGKVSDLIRAVGRTVGGATSRVGIAVARILKWAVVASLGVASGIWLIDVMSKPGLRRR